MTIRVDPARSARPPTKGPVLSSPGTGLSLCPRGHTVEDPRAECDEPSHRCHRRERENYAALACADREGAHLADVGACSALGCSCPAFVAGVYRLIVCARCGTIEDRSTYGRLPESCVACGPIVATMKARASARARRIAGG